MGKVGEKSVGGGDGSGDGVAVRMAGEAAQLGKLGKVGAICEWALPDLDARDPQSRGPALRRDGRGRFPEQRPADGTR